MDEVRIQYIGPRYESEKERRTEIRKPRRAIRLLIYDMYKDAELIYDMCVRIMSVYKTYDDESIHDLLPCLIFLSRSFSPSRIRISVLYIVYTHHPHTHILYIKFFLLL